MTQRTRLNAALAATGLAILISAITYPLNIRQISNPIVGIVGLAAIALWAYWWLGRPRKPHQPKPTFTALPLVTDAHPIEVKTAGVNHRVKNLLAATGRKPRLDQRLVADMTAALQPQPTNRHDRNAVKVLIEGKHVGYLPAEIAAHYQPFVQQLAQAGYLPAVPANIWTVARKDDRGRRVYYGDIRLTLAPPHLSLPVNDPPTAPYSLVPWGTTIQVTGEEHHLDVISDYLNPAVETLAIGTLHQAETTPRRDGAKPIIEVRIDGHTVGQLTTGSSQHFTPTVTHLNGLGLTCAVWLKIKGSPIAAQITLHATKAHELEPAWFAHPITRPALHTTAEQVDDALAADIDSIRTDTQADQTRTQE